MAPNKKCFVIMPFSQTTEVHDKAYWTKFFKDYIQRTVQELGYTCERSKASARNIINGIIDQLFHADLVIAVLTDRNPNVYYELGARHALAHGTLMMIERPQPIPFDLSGYGVIRYSDRNRPRDRQTFKNQLEEMIEEIERRSNHDGPIGDYLSSNDATLLRASLDVEKTPLSIKNALEVASQDLLIVGQNLYTMVQSEEIQEQVLTTLKKKPRLRIRILIADSQFEPQVKALSEIIDEAMIAQFPLVDREFGSWIETWRQQRPNQAQRLMIRKCRRVGNVSATLVDSNLNNGLLLVRPVLYHTSSNARPCMWLRRLDAPTIFDAYKAAFDQIWSHGETLDQV